MKQEDYKNICILFLIFIFSRLILIQKYPRGFDSFYYLNLFKGYEVFVYLIVGLFSIFSVCLFYILCRQFLDKNFSFISSCFFIISPILFTQTNFNFIDKNPISLCLILLSYIFLFMKLPEYKRIFLLLIVFLPFMYVWKGAFIMIIIIGLILSIKYVSEKKYLGSACILVISFLLLYSKQSLITSYLGIKSIPAELSSINNLNFQIEYVLVIIFLIFLWIKIALNIKFKVNNLQYLFLAFVITLVTTIFMFRLNLLFLPIFYVYFGLFLKYLNDNLKKSHFNYILCLFFLVTIIGGLSIYFERSQVNDDLLSAISYINSQDSNCIVSIWDRGNLLSYYSDKAILFKSSPAKNQLDYFVYGKETDCSILFSEDDVGKFQVFLESEQIEMDIKDFHIMKNLEEFKQFGGYYIR